ncbi:MAG: phosphocholine cytidylyltransferase family protein [Gemmatimonadota bacterium]
MKALILAAGRGTRLGLGHDVPKCLAAVGDRTLLDHYLDVLDALGVHATIVVGHGAARIERHVAARRAPPTLVLNARYAEGSIVSLAEGLAAIEPGASVGEVSTGVLLMDGDVAFAPALLHRLLEASAPDALLVDVGAVFTDEQYMAGIRGGRVVTLRRAQADGHDAQGEWVGFAKLGAPAAERLREAATAQIALGETTGGYEDALAGLLTEFEFTCVPTGGLPWVEVDFPEDLARAGELLARGVPRTRSTS